MPPRPAPTHHKVVRAPLSRHRVTVGVAVRGSQLSPQQLPQFYMPTKQRDMDALQKAVADMAVVDEQTVVIALDASNFAEHAVTCK